MIQLPAGSRCVALRMASMNGCSSWTSTLVAKLTRRAALSVGATTLISVTPTSACDSMPLVVLRAEEESQRDALAAELAAIAWSAQQVGQWQYVVVAADAELGQLEGLEADFEGVALIAPDSYARSGEVLAQLGLDATPEELALSLAETLAAYDPPTKRSRQHVAAGKREGISWEGELPVSDPQARDD